MKAHIAALPRLVLGWALPDADRAALETACRAAGLPLRMVEPAETGLTVGRLCGLPEGRNADALPVPATAAAVLCGLSGPELDGLLAAIRAAGAQIPLKAVVTAHNRAWPFARLMQELTEEHAAIRAAQEDK